MMKTELLYHIIDRYLGGTASNLEAKRVDDWYEGFEKKPGFTAKERNEVEKAGLVNLRKLKILLYNTGST